MFAIFFAVTRSKCCLPTHSCVEVKVMKLNRNDAACLYQSRSSRISLLLAYK